MEGNELIDEVANGLMAEAEYNAFEDYKSKIRRGKATEGMAEYAERMVAMSMSPSVMEGGNWSVTLEIPYKSPFGESGFEYRKRRRVEYAATDTGTYEVSGSYGIDRRTSSTDKMVTNAILAFCNAHGVRKVTIIREKI